MGHCMVAAEGCGPARAVSGLSLPTPLLNMASNYQINLSEQLRLLHHIGYLDRDMRYQHPGAHRKRMSPRDVDNHRELRLLDSIAVALTTGKPGDVFAAAFDKREHMELVLAKNGPPTSEDIAAANELFSLIASPTVTNALHLFPFLIRRCGENINKRILKLHASIESAELRSDFTSSLQAYVPEANIRVEFPGFSGNHLCGKYGDGSFLTAWNNLVEDITSMTSHGLDAEDPISSKRKYGNLCLSADALARSRFLQTLLDDRCFLNVGRTERVEKLKRRLDKICQYMSGITHLIRKAKRLLPISHHWVMDAFTGTGEGVYNLCDSPHDVVARGLRQPSLSRECVDKLHERFPFILNGWGRRQTVHAYVHAELRIIFHLDPTSAFPLAHPIGVSKRSCLCCTLWIGLCNRLLGTGWLTSGCHGKPHPNWAIPSASEDGIDDLLLGEVRARLVDVFGWLFPDQMPDDEYA